MQQNKWESFLSDPELTSGKMYHGKHNGEYLFGKVCHDALECLNNYLAILSLMVSQDVDVSQNTLDWLASNKRVVETAVSEIYSLEEQCRDLPDSSKEWPPKIQRIGSILGEVQFLADNFQGINESVKSKEKDLVTMVMVNLHGVQAIYKDILAENYKQLLTTPKYNL